MVRIIFLMSAILGLESAHAGFVLESDADITINDPIFIMNGKLTVIDNPDLQALFTRDDTLPADDLVFRSAGDTTIGAVEIVTAGTITIEAQGRINIQGDLYGAREVLTATEGVYRTILPDDAILGTVQLDNAAVDGPALWLRAVDKNWVGIINWLADHREVPGQDATYLNGTNIWIRAAARGNVDVLEVLRVRRIPGANALTDRGFNVIATAAANRRLAALEWFLAHPEVADFNAINDAGNNIWILAAAASAADVLGWLQRNNIFGRNVVNDEGNDAHRIAAQVGGAALKWFDEHQEPLVNEIRQIEQMPLGQAVLPVAVAAVVVAATASMSGTK